MNIKIKEESRFLLKDLTPGAVFWEEGDAYMVVDQIHDISHTCCVNLKDGHLAPVENSIHVRLLHIPDIKAEII